MVTWCDYQTPSTPDSIHLSSFFVCFHLLEKVIRLTQKVIRPPGALMRIRFSSSLRAACNVRRGFGRFDISASIFSCVTIYVGVPRISVCALETASFDHGNHSAWIFDAGRKLDAA